VHHALLGEDSPNLLKVWYTQTVGLKVRLSEIGIGAEGFSELLSIGCLVLAVVETEQAEVVMEEMTQGGEDPQPERLKKPLTRPEKKPFEVRKERMLDHVHVDHAASQVTPEKVTSLNNGQGERMRRAETQGSYHPSLRFFIQNPIIDIPAKLGSIHFPGRTTNWATGLMHAIQQASLLEDIERHCSSLKTEQLHS